MRDCRIISLIATVVCLACEATAADYMRGKVVMEDGSAPPARVLIQRACPGASPLTEATTTKQGIYIWKVTNNLNVPCVLWAVLEGYESSKIDTSLERLYFSSELPPLVLKAKSPGATADAPSPLPRAAAKSWNLALTALNAKNWREAERLLRLTIRAVPDFAPAWNSLGVACQYQGKAEDARAAYQHAIKLDPHLLLPYLNLTRLEISSQRWAEALKDAESLIKADTGNLYMEAYLHEVIALYAMHDLNGVEATLKKALPLDKKHALPGLEYFMGAVLGEKGDLEGSAEHLRKYLQLAPNAHDAEVVRAYLSNLGTASAASMLPLPSETQRFSAEADPNLPIVGDAWVPGGMNALSKAARLNVPPSEETFFLAYCRAISTETSKMNNMRTPGYSANLEAYMAAVAELTGLGEHRGGKTLITLSLVDSKHVQKTRQILSLLGWKVVEEAGAARIEPGDQEADGPRQQIPRAFGVDQVAMQNALQTGKSFQFEVPSEDARLIGGVAWWGALTKEFSSLPGGLAEGFARDPRLAKTYAALGAMPADAAKAIVAHAGLRALAAQYSDILWLYSDKFSVSAGAVKVPGGVEAEKVWANLVAANPRDPPAFFKALLAADRGRVAAFYSVLAHADAAHQRFFTKTLGRTKSFYTWYRNSDDLRDGIVRPGRSWRVDFFQKVPLDRNGNIRFPGGKPAWANASASDEDALLHLNSLEALVEIGQLEERRATPLDDASARLLERHFHEWRSLFPYFDEMPGLGHGDLEALEVFSKAVAGYRRPQQNMVMGYWHSLVALIVLGRKAGSLDDAAAVRAFRRACEGLLADDYSAQALAVLREIAGSNSNLDDAVAEGLLRLDGPRRAAFERVRELQGVPRLQSMGGTSDPAGTLAALAGLVYGAVVSPESLLISEDPTFVRKHQYVPDPCIACGAASIERLNLFSVANLSQSDTPPGSHVTGGFMGFDKVAKNFVSGGQSVSPALLAESHPQMAQPTSASAPSDVVFRATARLVQVFATVTDNRGRYVDDITRDGFTLMDNGTPLRIAAFENETSGISCTLLLDTTESMRASLPALKKASLKFIEALRPIDSVAVYALKNGITELQPFTTDKSAAARAVLQTEPGGMTALYDGLVRTVRDIAVRAGKKAIVVFTDGDDNISTLTGETAILRAKTAGVPIYTIAKGKELRDETLRQLSAISRDTGGMSFVINGSSEIPNVFERVYQDVMHGYLLAFQPPGAEGHTWHTIDVLLKSPKGLKVRARDGYYPE
ncbi:MAG TPA: VWA domain-containing protein [Bryobacteraceae bacterium]|nr:VWA domain-containing protein [Bryobacteraceae bacterium]